MGDENLHQSPPISNVDQSAQQTLIRYLQDLPEADKPSASNAPSRKTPNSRANDGKPRLLLMGQRRSGKSSISSVVFHKLPPPETLYLETTTRIKKEYMHSFMDFQVWDFPGHLNYTDPSFDTEEIFGEIGALIWVIDAQDDFFDAVTKLNELIQYLQENYPEIIVEVFIHKVDGLSDDYLSDTYQIIVDRVQDELEDSGHPLGNVSFHRTSIYDHSIYEAFSKVIQKLIFEIGPLESLLTTLCANCKMEKAYLFDVLSKIYIASDLSPSDSSSYEISSEYVDLVVDISEIYGWDRNELEGGDTEQIEEDPEVGNQDAESLIVLEKKNGSYLYLKEINKYLALICIMGDDSPTDRKALIDYNVGVFQETLKQIFPR
ncbi:hypothetical protein BT63DRAFT_397377 [Microthyrium microscopicum]|uniref:GTP-binding protein n=1 Tax=Microthyrium microscopicum TaxID=703497 RepID=A0A6A6UP65_9PEZI|nr:hypothetical protein BT63DRAFT_397377 [Microthyrium microscopicum]